MVNMGGSRKVKRVTWASDVNLCQVRMFLLEESPSEVSFGTQDHLQAKSSGSILHEGLGSYVNLPPGFEGLQHANSQRLKLSKIRLVKWKFPMRFEVHNDWRMVAGEESTEVEAQNQRESGVLEAVYPWPSAIPPNPSGLLDMVEYSNNTEQFPLVVPLTPIEEEDASIESRNVQSVHGEADFITAAQAAVTSILAGQNQGSVVDHELLIKILSNPKMVEHLVASHDLSSGFQSIASTAQIMPGSSSFTSLTSNTNLQHIPSPNAPGTQAVRMHIPTLRPPLMAPLASVPTHIIRPEVHPTGIENGPPFFPPASVSNLRHNPPTEMISAPFPSVGLPVKDINYYKSLIQQHGGEKQEPTPTPHQFTIQSSQEQMNMSKARDPKQKLKPCMYFNTPKGCRYGANCDFYHDGTAPEVPSTKRVKLDREITGLLLLCVGLWERLISRLR